MPQAHEPFHRLAGSCWVAVVLLAACAQAPSQEESARRPDRDGARPASVVGSTAVAGSAIPEDKRAAVAGRLLVAGDLAFSHEITKQLQARAGHADGYPLAGVAKRVEAANWAIGNLECVASSLGRAQADHNPFRCAPTALQLLRTAGFDGLSVANNHSFDYGVDAFYDSRRNLEAAGFQVLGAETHSLRPRRPVIRTLAGTRVGVLAYYIQPKPPLRDVMAARAQVDVLLVFNHWGHEGRAEPQLVQRTLARAYIDAGADVVVGTHAHVYQPHEWYRGKLIAYGLGNSVFPATRHDEAQRRGAFLEVDVAAGRIVAQRLLPTRLDDHGAPYFATPPERVTALAAARGADLSPHQPLLPVTAGR